MAGYNPTRVCITGTRVKILNDVTASVQEPSTDRRLTWIHGLAGLGKSSIAASVCQRFEEKGILAASFFCKRDNPELRDPRRALTTVVYGLALRCKPYGDAVVAAIRADPELHTRHIQPLYDTLVNKPLQSLAGLNRPAGTFVVVVDALDECGDIETRKQLLICLRGMSRAVPWLKVIVTSRPDLDIQEFFGQASADWFTAYNVLEYDALDDIRIFVEDQLTTVVQIDNWPEDGVDRLCHGSGGLFIWAQTACNLISNGHDDPCDSLGNVLVGTGSTDLSAVLDNLYTTAVKSATLGGGSVNLNRVLGCLGAVVVTATRTPLSVSGLGKLLRGRISLYTLNRVLRSLASVLYLDQKQSGAVRVSHPSFMDYITDPSRSKDLCVDLDEQNTILAECCLETMTKELVFNICGLETSHLLNSDIPNLETRVQAAIGPHLNYSCLYWSSHLAKARKNALEGLLGRFLFERELLYWIEALSLLRKLNVALSSLLELSRSISVSTLRVRLARGVDMMILSRIQ
jgi:hypothetical protein